MIFWHLKFSILITVTTHYHVFKIKFIVEFLNFKTKFWCPQNLKGQRILQNLSRKEAFDNFKKL